MLSLAAEEIGHPNSHGEAACLFGEAERHRTHAARRAVEHARSGAGLLLSEGVATFGLIGVVVATSRTTSMYAPSPSPASGRNA